MKMFTSSKRGIALCLSLLLTFALSACSGSSTNNTSTPAAVPASTPAAASAVSTPVEKLKLVLVVGRINDMSFQQSAYDGSQRIKAELSEHYDVQVVEMGTDSTVWESAIYDVCEKGADIVVGMGFRNLENFQNIPPEYPDIKFILLDEAIDFSAGNLPNLLAVTFKSNESGFLAGAAAAYFTTSEKGNSDNVIGYVGGTEAVTVTNFLVGYAEGAHYVNPDTKILTAYVGDYVDTAKAKDLTNAQIAEKADIIFQVAGGAGNGVIEAAAEAEGIMAIGVDADQYAVLEGTDLQSSIATSSLKRLDNALFIIATDYAENADNVAFGSNITFGLEAEAVGIVYNDNLTESIGSDNVASLRELEVKIQSGEIVVSESAALSADEIAKIVRGE